MQNGLELRGREEWTTKASLRQRTVRMRFIVRYAVDCVCKKLASSDFWGMAYLNHERSSRRKNWTSADLPEGPIGTLDPAILRWGFKNFSTCVTYRSVDPGSLGPNYIYI